MNHPIERDVRSGRLEHIKTILPRALQMLWNQQGRRKRSTKTKPDIWRDAGSHEYRQLNVFDQQQNI